MPANTKTHKLYEKLKKRGYSKGSAAKISQSVTGKSLKTGKKPKKRSKRK
uniref:Uncharacterized protein n=1 Tax=viral metagenome TaxID=1070528 RepID=A0A6H1ZLY8_9ZZZZ